MKANQFSRGLPRRLSAMVLAVCMVFTMSPPVTAAEASDKDSGEPMVISGFAELPENIREQSVPLGVSLGELNLPDAMTATVGAASVDAEPTPDTEPEEPKDSGAATLPTEEQPTLGTSDEPASKAEIIEENIVPLAASPSDAENNKPEPTLPSNDVTTPAAITVEGITWESDPLYDSETEGTYLFTAVLPSGYAVEDGTSLPEITVVVGQAEQSAVDKVIAMIDALPTMDEWTAMDETAARAVMDEILAAKKAYDALTAEEKAQIDETRTAKLLELAEMAQQLAGVMPMAATAFGTNCTWEVTTEGVLILAPKTSGETGTLPTFNSSTSQPWNSQKNQIKAVRVESGVKANADSKYLFNGLSACITMNLSGLDTSNTTNMGGMFHTCQALASLDLSGFDTANVTAMDQMFYNCSNLQSLTLDDSFSTANVANMRSMFFGCKKLTALDLSGFDTAKVTFMDQMFYNCSNLQSLTLDNSFSTAEVTNMNYMFNGCSGLTTLDLSSFNTAAVTSMSNMFNGCSDIVNISLHFFLKDV